MTSKNLFFRLVKEDGKRRLWASALTFLIFFFALPVTTALTVSGYDKNTADGLLRIQQNLIGLFGGIENGFIAFLIATLAVVLGVTGFSYLHSKQKVDFYHGIPVLRTTLFLANYVSGILILAVVYLVNLLLALGIAGVTGCMAGGMFGAAMGAYGFFMLHYLMLYSFAVLAMVLTGNVVVGILGTVLFSTYFPALILVLELFYQEFFKTGYRGGSEFLVKLLDKCSPLTFMIGNIGYYTSRTAGERALSLVAATVVFLIVTVVSLVLYKKRGSEAAGRAMAFRISEPIIRIPVVILCAMTGSLMFWAFRAGIGWMVFGLLCGAVISHCVIEIIYHFDFKKLFEHKLSLAGCLLVSAAVFCIFRFDVFGYDNYLPKADKLESAVVKMDYRGSWISYGSFTEDGGAMIWDDESQDDYILEHMKITEFADVLALAELGNEQAQNPNRGADTYLSVVYRMKNGRKVYRSYQVELDTVENLLNGIIDLPSYKKGIYPILSGTDGKISKIRITQAEEEKEITGKDEAVWNEILTAYQEELTALKSETMKQEEPVAIIQFVTEKQERAEWERQSEKDSDGWRYRSVRATGQYPIYPSFTKTLNLLSQNGVELNVDALKEQIQMIEIDGKQFTDGHDASYEYAAYEYEAEEVDPTIEITDPKEIKELLDLARFGEYAYMNLVPMEKESYSIIGNGKNGSSVAYLLDEESVPEFLKERVKEAYTGKYKTVFD